MSKENEENESEINEIEYLSASKEISEDDDFLDNEDYNIFNKIIVKKIMMMIMIMMMMIMILCKLTKKD